MHWACKGLIFAIIDWKVHEIIIYFITTLTPQILAVLINLVAQALPYFGVVISTEELTQAIQAFVAIATGLWIWYERTQLRKVSSNAESDVTLAGINK